MTAEAAYRPVIADWLRPSLGWSSRYGLRRDPSHIALVDSGSGEAARLLNTFNTDRRLSRGLIFDLPAAVRAAAPAPGAIARAGLTAISPLKPVELSWTDELGSRFDRDLADPGLGYQLGIGTLTELRFLDGDTAAMALRRDAFRARSGVRVGSSASVDVGYSESDVRVFDLRVGDRSQLERSWPSVQVSWQDVPLPGFLEPVLQRWSVSTGYVRSERATTLLGQVTRVRSLDETTIPLELRFDFPGSMALAYLGTRTAGDGRDPTGTTAQDASSHSVDLSGRVELPGGLGDRLPEPIRLSVTYDYEQERQVRRTGPEPETSTPTAFVDYLNRRVYVSASTLVARMDIGLQISYVDRRTFIGTQVGSSQFRLGLFGQFNMRAGREVGR